MAFSNTWDQTFPADTELANLVGANLRQLRVDVQQRMAAITGLDASKPNFAGDAQPSSWNGMLYFATDSGKVYLFINPTWSEVTGTIDCSRHLPCLTNASLIPPNNFAFISPQGVVGNPESTILHAMSAPGQFRNMTARISTGQSGTGNLVFTLRKNAADTPLTCTIAAGAVGGTTSSIFNTVVPFNAGDSISVRVNNNASTASAQLSSIDLLC